MKICNAAKAVSIAQNNNYIQITAKISNIVYNYVITGGHFVDFLPRTVNDTVQLSQPKIQTVFMHTCNVQLHFSIKRSNIYC
jgi:hypothetical protein